MTSAYPTRSEERSSVRSGSRQQSQRQQSQRRSSQPDRPRQQRATRTSPSKTQSRTGQTAAASRPRDARRPQQQRPPAQRTPQPARTQRRPSTAAARPARTSGYGEPRRRQQVAYNDPRSRQQRRAPQTERERRARDRERRESNAALNGRLQPKLVGAVVLVIIVLVGIVWWNNRAVTITVDGNQTQVRVGSSLERVYDDSGDQVTAGNYVNVAGGVINQGGGEKFKANVNGSDLSGDDASSYKVHGGESISFSDGDDTMEPYTVEYQDIDPQLEMDGDEGIVYYVKQWAKEGKKEIRHGNESGKTADGDTVQEAQNLVIQRCNPKPANDEKLVALTFDDGPAANYTDEYLDILKQKNVKATFNLIGNQIDEFKDQANRIKDEGHQITSHTWTHAQMTKETKSQLQQELDDTYAKIKEVTGVDTTTLRPPYGSWMTDCWLNSEGSTSVVAIWTHDSEDWRRPGADAIVQNCTKDMQPGSIILMHDGGGDRSQDVEALPQIIDAWQNAGYKFVTLSELLQSDDSIPDDVASCDEKMPDDAVWPTTVAAGSENKGQA